MIFDIDPSQYSEAYDDYWSRSDRIDSASSDLKKFSSDVVSACGLGEVLDIGCGEGWLVGEFLRLGIKSHGIDVSQRVIDRCNKRYPCHFTSASVLNLPFEDCRFETVVSTDCLEHLKPDDVPVALREIHRVSVRSVFLQIATTQDRDGHWHLTVEGRSWWERKFFEAGFRKHPAYYKFIDYQSLNKDPWQIYILLEKVPVEALVIYPIQSLDEKHESQIDMMRDTGARSDAQLIRYQWASNYIKAGDRVLDAACGLGYGGHVARHLTHAAKVVGIDGSDYAIDYARKAFTCAEGRAEYRVGMLPGALSEFPDGSFEVIILFETLAHVEQPQQLLQEFYRLLTPGGRVIVSVPNDWSDEAGEEPNPSHLHVYDWGRLKSELSEKFILEDAYAQTASQCKVAGKGVAWERRTRSLKQVAFSEHPAEDCEWWLMTAMKSPLESMQPYEERMFANIAMSGHPTTRYSESYLNPWLMHAMVNVNCRLKNGDALEKLAENVVATSPKNSHDYAAALCVMAYRVLAGNIQESATAEECISKIDAITSIPVKGSMGLRWKVSLLFVKAKLLQVLGHLDRAKLAYIDCASHDVRSFGIHLATKTTESWFVAGRLAYATGELEEARSCWERGVESGSVLLSASLDEILINRSFPNRFNHGDGVREYACSWDNIARCANGLHLLKQAVQFDYAALENCFQAEYSTVTIQLAETRQQLIERTERLEQCSAELLDLTRDLVQTRQLLIERTERLEKIVNRRV
jgi:SAM-dependent methyltransferase